MENKSLDKQARKYLYDNTTYPSWWIDELSPKRLIAIYFNEKRKKEKQSKGEQNEQSIKSSKSRNSL